MYVDFICSLLSRLRVVHMWPRQSTTEQQLRNATGTLTLECCNFGALSENSERPVCGGQSLQQEPSAITCVESTINDHDDDAGTVECVLTFVRCTTALVEASGEIRFLLL